MTGQRFIIDIPIGLPTTGTSGYTQISLPYDAQYVAVLNNSGASVSIVVGQYIEPPIDVTPVASNAFLAFPVMTAQKFTLFWRSDAELSSANNALLIKFSSDPIVLSGGVTSTGGVASAVDVVNTPTVNVGGTVHVSVDNAPTVTLSAGSQVQVTALPALAAGAAHIGDVGIDAPLPAGTNTIGGVTLAAALPAGANNIGSVGIASTPSAQAMTTGAKGGSVSLAAGTAKRLSVGAGDVANRKSIAIYNSDSTNTIYIGDSSLTSATTGFPVLPGAMLSFDQNPGSSVPVYGYCANAVTVYVLEVS